ncbi:MAG: HpcH/HpaI aldolase family protein [Planctomycetota bacterium]|jgi:4-hydroxy-2-oxoheptanedioate aldolase
MKKNSVRDALKRGEPQVGTWLSLSSPLAARFMAKAGFPWLTLDMEHSNCNWETASSIFAHVAEADCVPLIRVPSITHENAKRALDLGAFGIVFPMCNTVELAELAVSSCKYPPIGTRSVGGSVHALNFGTNAADYYRRANDEVLVVVQAEHIDAVDQIDRILSVPGVDAVFVGPNDLLASMGKTPQMETDDPQFVDALDKILRSAKSHGVAPGIHVADAQAAKRRMEQGWQFIAVSSELGFMNQAAGALLKDLGRSNQGQVARY